MLLFQVKTELQQKHITFNFKISEQQKSAPSKRTCFISDLEPSEYLMATEDYDATETEIEKSNQKKIEQSDNKEELRIDSEKSKVKLTKTSVTIK